MDMKRVLITGGAGYIALNLLDYLHYRNIIVLNHIDKIWKSSAEDINDISNYDVIIHLAAMSNIFDCMNDQDGSIRDNILSAFNVFNLANEQGIPVIFSSSQAAKTPEENIYAMQKRIIEVAAIRLNELGADIKILRLTNVYGGMNFLKNKSVIANFINAKRKNEDLVINGNGEQIRDFIHVSDVCDAIYKCIEYDIKIPKPIDIGTGIGTSIYELAKMTKNKFVFDEYSKMVGVLKNIAEVKKAEEIIGFKTTRKIQDYMKEG